MGETLLIVCPCWFIAIERLYWNFKLYCTTFFSKMCASKFGVRLIYGCGLYMDVYGMFVLCSLFVGSGFDFPAKLACWCSPVLRLTVVV